MTCCPPAAHAVEVPSASPEDDDRVLLELATRLGDGTCQLEFAVPDAHCAQCIRTIETGLDTLPQVVSARVNLSRRRVRVSFDPARGRPSEIAATIRASGYHTYPLDAAEEDPRGDPALRELLRSLAVAGFAAGNIMLFSVSVWAGAEETTRDFFHWLSAIIAIPAIAYAGQPFFRSAWRALRVGKTNMDVPISIGVVLATLLSLYETAVSGEHAYFDASVTLLFFLLIGRTLDHLMRERARNAIGNLARLVPRTAVLVDEDGRREQIALDEIRPGMRLELRAGDRFPVDATVLEGTSTIDCSIVTGETMETVAKPGLSVLAGSANLSGPLLVRSDKPAAESFVARMTAMMEAAEGAKTKARRIADRAASYYAPVVHALAAATFLGWLVLTGDWHAATLNAVAVLIITCPCALALAVPIVHVVAAGRLFERGILMRDGAALERAAEVVHVAFDKTGTLTEGRPVLTRVEIASPDARAVAGALAAASNHPLSRALAGELGPAAGFAGTITEFAGRGVEGVARSGTWRLGSASWCGVPDVADAGMRVWLVHDGDIAASFDFADRLRSDAAAAVARLRAMAVDASLLSGDRQTPAAAVGQAVGIADVRATLLPGDKLAALAGMGKVMMVGDGINDAPALRAAHVSMAPSTAADIGRTAADFVFTGGLLTAVPFVIETARRAARTVNQNLMISIGYNAMAVPLAITGQVTPLVAAVAMSSSSLIVVLNALRLRLDRAAPRGGANLSALRKALA